MPAPWAQAVSVGLQGFFCNAPQALQPAHQPLLASIGSGITNGNKQADIARELLNALISFPRVLSRFSGLFPIQQVEFFQAACVAFLTLPNITWPWMTLQGEVTEQY